MIKLLEEGGCMCKEFQRLFGLSCAQIWVGEGDDWSLQCSLLDKAQIEIFKPGLKTHLC